MYYFLNKGVILIKIRFIKITMLLLIIAMNFQSVYAQQEILSVELKGNKRISDETIKFYLELKPSEHLTQNKINQAAKRLYATGFFSDIKISSKNHKLIVQVTENPVINKIFFEGNKKIKDNNLKKELSLQEKQVFNLSRLQNDINRINFLYRKLGFYNTKIVPKLIKNQQDSVSVVFEIYEGYKAKIKDILFAGNNVFTDKDLKKVILSKETQWYRIFSSLDLYDADRLEYDKDLLKKYYMENGYADFNVETAISELSPGKDYFIISFLINEGKIYKFDGYTIENRLNEKIDVEKLKKFVSINSGITFNESLIDYSVDKMVQHMGDMGFAFADIDYELEKDRKLGTVKVKFIVHETHKMFINKINIKGNVRTLDRVIRREFRISEGDPYSTSKIQRSRQRINNLGYFESVDFQNEKTNVHDKIDVDVKVKEMSTGAVKFAVGYNTAVGPIGGVSISEYNFLGKGQILELDYEKAKKASDVSFSFTEPKFMDRDLSLGFDIFSNNRNRKSESSYDSQNKGFALRMGYELTEHLSHGLHYSIKREKISNISSDASKIIKAQAGNTLVSSVGQRFTYDKLDNRLDPHNGYFIQFSQDIAGLGGDAKYLQNQLYASYHKPLIRNDIIFNLIGRAGNITGIAGKKISLSDNFFVGEDYIRGFNVAGIGPRSLEKDANGNKKDDALGGKTYYAATAEIHFPLGLPSELRMKGAVFTDFATLYGNDAWKKIKGIGIADSKNIRASYGAGIIWESPLGLMRLDYGVAFKKEWFDKLHKVRFSIGTTF